MSPHSAIPPQFIDVFNGDADGLCALQQLHLATPRSSQLVTGVKRDNALLQQVNAAAGAHITVLDISFANNRADVLRLLTAGAQINYFDHHYATDLPVHPQFTAHISQHPQQGTSYLVNTWLNGRAINWAIVGTFGDNFDTTALELATAAGLSDSETVALRELGILLNYNSYGTTVADLHCAPAALFAQLQPYANPLAFITAEPIVTQLRAGYADDMAQAEQLTPLLNTDRHAVFMLPAQSWARRVSGVYSNQLVQHAPQRAHALLTELENGSGAVVSIRAPLAQPIGADQLTRQFETGGGRGAAAGINYLPAADYHRFITAFLAAF